MRRIGLYIHWPFCQAKCPYCDFNSHVVVAIDHEEWRRAYAAEIASAHRMRAGLGLGGGQLVANPIPPEDEIPRAELEPVIAAAQDDAATQGIAGKAVTPFLLQRIFDLTGGRSLDANIALVRNNARLGAAIARELSSARG